MNRKVHCSNKDCIHCCDGICQNDEATKDFLKDKDTVYITLDSCNLEEIKEDDPYWYDRMMFDVYMQQEADGYFN